MENLINIVDNAIQRSDRESLDHSALQRACNRAAISISAEVLSAFAGSRADITCNEIASIVYNEMRRL